jgi:hypothetical protein
MNSFSSISKIPSYALGDLDSNPEGGFWIFLFSHIYTESETQPSSCSNCTENSFPSSITLITEISQNDMTQGHWKM